MTSRVRLVAAVAAGCALIVASFAGAGPAAAAPAAAWQIRQSADPTVLPPHTTNVAHYHAVITNVGGAEAAAGVTVTDTFSEGAAPFISAIPAEAARLRVGGGPELPCVVTVHEVHCDNPEAVPPGALVQLEVPLVVEAEPPPVVTSVVSISSPGVATATDLIESSTGTEPPPYAFVAGPFGLSGSAFDEAGATPPAGAHPFDVELSVHLPSSLIDGSRGMQNRLHTLGLVMPAGLVVDPLAAGERCTLAEFQSDTAPTSAGNVGCPAASQVGLVNFSVLHGLEGLISPLIDMVPPPGVPAEFAFGVDGTIVHIRGGLDGGFHLTAGSEELLSKYPIPGLKVSLWGDPSDPRHDVLRHGEGLEGRCSAHGCSIEPSSAPFVTMPTSCDEPLLLTAESTGTLGGAASGSRPFEDLEGNSVTPAGCNQIAFEPTIASQATTNQGESPSGLEFSIHQPQEESLEGRATAALKDATVALPEGVSLNASAANGLASCTEEEMGYAPEEGKIRFQTKPQTCPDAAKVGTMSVKTPLLEAEQLPARSM